MSELKRLDSLYFDCQSQDYFKSLAKVSLIPQVQTYPEKGSNVKFEEFIDEILFSNINKPQPADQPISPQPSQSGQSSLDEKILRESTSLDSKPNHQLFKVLEEDPIWLPKPATTAAKKKSKSLKVERMNKFVFKESCIKKKTKKFAISKFLARLFFKYQSEYGLESQVSDFNKCLSETFYSKQEKFSMEKGIPRMFGINDDDLDEKVSCLNRKVMGDILNKHLKSQVILNLFTEQNRLSYLIGSKVYALRTRSRKLIKKASFR